MPAHWNEDLASETFAYLTTTGRRSGDPHRIEIWFALENDRIYLLSGGRDASDWVRNIQTNPEVTIEIGGELFRGNAHILHPADAEDPLARNLLVQKYQKKDELAAWKKRSLPVVIELDEARAI